MVFPIKATPEGGYGMEAARLGNALSEQLLKNRMQELENQFYAPKTQSEIDYRKALTTGQNIDNTYSPERNKLANQHAGLVNQMYVPNIMSEIGLRNATSANTMAELPFIPTKYENQTRNSLTNAGALNNSIANSFREWTKTPEGQKILMSPEGGQIAGAIFQNMQKQAGMLSSNPMNNISSPQNQNPLQGAPSQELIKNIQESATDNGANWKDLPAESKNGIIAQGMGMGIDPLKMKKYVGQGLDMKQIAEKEGLDPENLPQARYFPTSATKTRTQLVEQVGAEMDYLSSATTPIIKKYADTFAGFSGKRISDMLSRDKDAQKRFGQYIGALSVQTGLANGRVALEGGKAGVEVMKLVKDSALKGIDQNSPIKMSGTAYEEAQKTIDKILQRGAKIRTTTGMSPLSKDSESVGLNQIKPNGKNVDLSSMSDDELRKIAGM